MGPGFGLNKTKKRWVSAVLKRKGNWVCLNKNETEQLGY